jgi:hypothetical protein
MLLRTRVPLRPSGRSRLRFPAAAALATVLVAGAGACGGDGDDGGGVASLAGGDEAAAAPTGDEEGGAGGTGRAGAAGGGGAVSGASAEFEDAMLRFARCMRDQGVDFPDPRPGGDGMVMIGPGPGDGPPSEEEHEELEAARKACEPILEEVEGSMPQPSPEEEAEMRDRALAFSRCMREQGIEDFPDPTFGEGGRVGIRTDGGPR